jgi:hypothetical protein
VQAPFLANLVLYPTAPLIGIHLTCKRRQLLQDMREGTTRSLFSSAYHYAESNLRHKTTLCKQQRHRTPTILRKSKRSEVQKSPITKLLGHWTRMMNRADIVHPRDILRIHLPIQRPPSIRRPRAPKSQEERRCKSRVVQTSFALLELTPNSV